MSQTQLAEKINTHLTNINRVENGKYVPSLETVLNLAKVLEVPLDTLVNGTQYHPTQINIEDRSLAERVKLLNTLEPDERQAIIKVIDSMIAKQKILSLLTKLTQQDLVSQELGNFT